MADPIDFLPALANLGTLRYLHTFCSRLHAAARTTIADPEVVQAALLFLSSTKPNGKREPPVLARTSHARLILPRFLPHTLAPLPLPLHASHPVPAVLDVLSRPLEGDEVDLDQVLAYQSQDDPHALRFFAEEGLDIRPGQLGRTGEGDEVEYVFRTTVRNHDGSLRGGEGGRKMVDIASGAVFASFFAGDWLVLFFHALLHLASDPETTTERLLDGLRTQFPTMYMVLDHVFAMEQLVFFDDDPKLDGPLDVILPDGTPARARRVHIRAPFDHKTMKMYYPQLSKLIKWLASIRVRVLDRDDKYELSSTYAFDSAKQVFSFSGIVAGDQLLWTATKTRSLSPARMEEPKLSDDGSVLLNPRTFDLRFPPWQALSLMMDMHMTAFGFNVLQLPVVGMELTTDDTHPEVASLRVVEVINQTSTLKFFSWMLNLATLYQELIATFLLRIIIGNRVHDPDADADDGDGGSGSGSDDDEFFDAEDTPEADKTYAFAGPNQFAFLLTLALPLKLVTKVLSHIWDKFVKRYTWVDILRFAADVLDAFVADLGTHMTTAPPSH